MAPKKDNVDLICSIAELAGLFERSSSLSDFLDTVVSVVAYHMSAAVCSIYLWDEEKRRLVLRANQGLNPDLIDRVILKSGEGLVGMALKELRPINSGKASDNPHYQYIPELNEEQYQSLLAVPILRGLHRVGVLVVQDPQQGYFGTHDAKALQAIAGQLATTIENAKLLISIYRDIDKEEGAEEGGAVPTVFRGVGVSRGHVIGTANVIGSTDSFIKISQNLGLTRPGVTSNEFRDALDRSEEQLEELQSRFETHHSDVASLIFSAQLLMLKDEQFSGAMLRRMEDGLRPVEAVIQVVNQYIQLFSASKNVRLKEKAQDVKDLGHRILDNLSEGESHDGNYEGEILVTGELLPSDIVKFAAERAAGLVMVGGGSSSHVTILARSMDLPMVVLNDRSAFGIKPGTLLRMDAEHGSVMVNPSEEVIARHRELVDAESSAEQLAAMMEDETTTCCGTRVRLMANINLLVEVRLAKRFRAEGIGLYRSEFPFIARSEFPSEEEQYRIYRTLIERMEGKPVTLRTLDIGGDKMLSYYPMVTEENPFLGLRAIRFSLRNKDIFVQQLRAMLRAGAGSDTSIMFPMISSLDDFLLACDIVHECAAELAEAGIEHQAQPKLGAMLELPSVIEIAEEMAEAADFLCIGSNDLVQYILAVDRTNEHVADLYLPYHPAVLRALKRVVDAADRANTPVSLCGEMAGTAGMLPFLLGIGLRTLSMDARLLPRAQAAIQEIDMETARAQADAMLQLSRISELEHFLANGAVTHD